MNLNYLNLFSSVAKCISRNCFKRRLSVNKFINLSLPFIQKISSSKSASTIKNYKTAINALSEFASSESYEMNQDTMVAFYSYLLNDRCKNTTSCYLRSLRSLYNMMVEQKIITQCFPFEKISTSNSRTSKRALGLNEIKKINNLSLKQGADIKMYQDIFMFSVYGFGIPFVDLANLKKENIKNNTIVFERSKTKQTIRIPITNDMQNIISRYWNKDSLFVFPILTHHIHDNKKAYNQYLYQLSKYNKNLKIIAEKAGVKRITSYVARHTWASIALQQNIDICIISQAMGHESLQTTQIYLKQFDDNTMKNISNQINSIITEQLYT